ncbi:MAG: HepT-like ribonuclease domain-containing protein [Burkholderiales bacterium]
MQPKTPKLLDDIRDAAAFIRDAARGKTLDDYRADRILRQAIERNFEIIGETMKRLAQHDPEIAIHIGEQARYEPVTCGEYILGRFNKAFAYRKYPRSGMALT